MTETAPDIQLLNEQVEKASRTTDLIREEIGKTIIGQTHMIDKLLIGLLANGHVLLEGVPGLAKTLEGVKLEGPNAQIPHPNFCCVVECHKRNGHQRIWS